MMILGTVISYLKKNKKLYKSRETPLELTSVFFIGNQQIFLYQEMQIDMGIFHRKSANFAISGNADRHGHFSSEISKFCYNKKYRYRLLFAA